MNLPRFIIYALLYSAIPASPQGVQAMGSNSLTEIVRIASDLRLPLGIVVGDGNQLCKPRTLGVSSQIDNVETIGSIASIAGYRSKQIGDVLVISPITVPGQLRPVLVEKLEPFPSLTGSLRYMGSVLQGWIASRFNGAKGYAVSGAEGGRVEKYTLTSAPALTATEVANRIVTLGPKGMWLLRSAVNPVTRNNDTQLLVLSYEKNAQEISTLTCGPKL